MRAQALTLSVTSDLNHPPSTVESVGELGDIDMVPFMVGGEMRTPRAGIRREDGSPRASFIRSAR